MFKKIVLLIVLFLAGVSVGMLLFPQLFPAEPSSIARQIRQGGYSLINPLLECDIGSKALSRNYISFQDEVAEKVDDLKQQGDVEEMAVYFRDLNNGLTFGVNANNDFTPASLLKLPIMIAYFKQAEVQPSILTKQYTYTGDTDLNEEETIKPTISMQPGTKYTVTDLIKRMTIYSDNNAMALLVENMPLPLQDRVYTDLGVKIPGSNGEDDYMSTVDYSSFFRILYNASYLNADYSQKALELLSKVDYAKALRAGVPKGVTVANKFGERTDDTGHQLHDCGIVYFKDNPYLLCVMSRGQDFNKLADSIHTISALVYQEVEKQIH
jgi:beta-lactamase class A